MGSSPSNTTLSPLFCSMYEPVGPFFQITQRSEDKFCANEKKSIDAQRTVAEKEPDNLKPT